MPTAYVDGTAGGKNQDTLVADDSEIVIELSTLKKQNVAWFTPAGNPAGAAFALEARFGPTWFPVSVPTLAAGAAASAIAAGVSECRQGPVNGADAIRIRRTDATAGQASAGVTVTED